MLFASFFMILSIYVTTIQSLDLQEIETYRKIQLAVPLFQWKKKRGKIKVCVNRGMA